MDKKKMLYGNEAREALKAGVDKLAKAVITTLGPKGRNVAIEKSWGNPSVIHDGVTVAKEVFLEDEFENMGAQMVKEAASKTNDAAGDGTTTATLLAKVIIELGFEELNKKDSILNPMIMKEGMEKAVDIIIDEIKFNSKKVKGKDIEKVATISAQNKEIGKLVAEAIEKVGQDGVVIAEEGNSTEMSVDYREGMEFDKGYMSSYFITDKDKMESEIENPAIILTDAKITNFDDLMPALEKIIPENKNIVIIADDISEEALAGLVLNKIRGIFNPLAIRAPGFGDRKKEMLEDLAILTGATVISELAGKKIDSITYEDCGSADKVWSDKDTTRIIGGKGNKDAISERIESLRSLLSRQLPDFDREKIQERLARLTSGVAVINVNATSEVEMREKKERVIDAISATKAAIEKGIVAGGGISLYRASDKLLGINYNNEDENEGVRILYRALKQPLLQLARNAGFVEEEVIKEIETHGGDYGLNVLTGNYGSMLEQGIIDPSKVTISAVENAVSVAMMILTTECLMVNIPQKEEKHGR